MVRSIFAVLLPLLLFTGCRLGFESEQVGNSFAAGDAVVDEHSQSTEDAGSPDTQPTEGEDSAVATDTSADVVDVGAGGGGDVGSNPSDATGPTQIFVEPMFPSHGRNWNDYVVRDSARIQDATDTRPCQGDEPTYRHCIHAAERQIARLDDVASCEGVVAKDELRAFRWGCFLRNGVAHAYSLGLLPGRGLDDLIDTAGWRTNVLHVDVESSVTGTATPLRFASQAAVWWSNPVRRVGGREVETKLSEPGTIYLVASSTVGGGFSLEADRVSLVVRRRSTYELGPGTSGNCDLSTGASVPPTGSCIVHGTGRRFVWVEGAFVGSEAFLPDRGLLLVRSSFSSLRNVLARNTSTSGVCVELSFGGGYVARDLRLERCGGAGLKLLESTFASLFDGLHSHQPRSEMPVGVWAERPRGDVWRDVFSSGAYAGLSFYSASNQTITGAVAVSGTWGMEMVEGGRSTLHHVTFARNSHNALSFFGSPSRLFIGQLLADQNAYGVPLDVQDSLLAHVVVTNSSNYGVRLRPPAARNSFQGVLVVGNNSPDCVVDNGLEAPGLIHESCTDTGLDGSNTYAGQASDAVLRHDRAPTSRFMGRIESDDLASPNDLNGQQQASSIFDWGSTESPYRMWGALGANGRCTNDCQLYDFRLDRSASLWGRSGNGADVNAPFVPKDRCPSAADGNDVQEDFQEILFDPWTNATETLRDGIGDDDGTCEPAEVCHNRFLTNALEILFDDSGDDDGLCESDEACTYSAHFGAYQGEGNTHYDLPCVFQDGLASKVELRVFPTCAQRAPVAVRYGGFRYNRATQTFDQIISLTNEGDAPFDVPVYFVFDLLTSHVTLANGDGSTACSAPIESPFIAIPPQGWAPNEEIQVHAAFRNPEAQGLSYRGRVLIGPENP